MSRQSDRDTFIATMTKEGLDLATIRALLSAERTLHRLAELECSSEAADRDRVKCPADPSRKVQGLPCVCEHWSGCGCADAFNPTMHHPVTRIAAQAAKVERQVTRALPQGFGVEFNGDPRGAAIILRVPSGRSDDWGGRGVCVP